MSDDVAINFKYKEFSASLMETNDTYHIRVSIGPHNLDVCPSDIGLATLVKMGKAMASEKGHLNRVSLSGVLQTLIEAGLDEGHKMQTVLNALHEEEKDELLVNE